MRVSTDHVVLQDGHQSAPSGLPERCVERGHVHLGEGRRRRRGEKRTIKGAGGGARVRVEN
jgi:hypothetical protein